MIAAIELLAGWLLLWKGGDLLVDAADRLGRSHGVPATLAGVFILGFGTSAPELATTVLATIEGKPAIALGNVVGSNIANVALILGITALIATIPVNRFLQRVEIPFCVAISGIAWFLAYQGGIDRWDGVILLSLFGGYGLFAMWTYKHRADMPTEEGDEVPPKRPAYDLSIVVLGLVSVVGGAWLFIEGAATVADWIGVSDGVIGLTLVALGTSLPELATGIAAIRADKPDLALGNVIGSNIFYLLLVLGVAAMLDPQQPEARMFSVDFPLMTGLVVFVLVLGVFERIPRWAGATLALTYVAYIVGFGASL